MDFEKPIREGYEFNSSQFASETWSLFKKHAGSFIGANVLFLIIYFVIALIPIVNLVAPFVLGALLAGYLIYAENAKTGTQKMADFFGGFSYIGQIALYYLVFFLIMIPIMGIFFGLLIPYELVGQLISGSMTPDEFGAEFAAQMFSGSNMVKLIGGYFVMLFIVLYFAISYSLTLPLIVNGKLGFWKAMETSRKTVGKKFFRFLGFYILLFVLTVMVFFVTLGTAMLVIYPLYMLLTYVMYQNIFQDNTEMVDVIDSFGSTSSDINSESQE